MTSHKTRPQFLILSTLYLALVDLVSFKLLIFLLLSYILYLYRTYFEISTRFAAPKVYKYAGNLFNVRIKLFLSTNGVIPDVQVNIKSVQFVSFKKKCRQNTIIVVSFVIKTDVKRDLISLKFFIL